MKFVSYSKGFTKQSLTIGTNGFKKLHKQICAKNAPKKEEFLKRTQWMKKDDVDELYMCAAIATKNFNFIADKVRPESGHLRMTGSPNLVPLFAGRQ